jgi:DNA-binding NarL/FixJ family response regulator
MKAPNARCARSLAIVESWLNIIMEGKRAMRVLLIDHQPHVRAAIQFLLDQQPDIDIVGTAHTCDALQGQLCTLKPDILLVRWELWRRPARELLRALDARPRLVVFSSRVEAEQTALESGADAFVGVFDPPETILSVLRRLGDERDDDEHEQP